MNPEKMEMSLTQIKNGDHMILMILLKAVIGQRKMSRLQNFDLSERIGMLTKTFGGCGSTKIWD